MTDPTQNIWLAKLAAWTHDPAEKALVLLRDPAGHEGGTVRELQQALFPAGLPKDLAAHVKRADHWASAADRPQFPRSDKDGRYAAWTQVRFDQNPVLIHPLSGTEYPLGKIDIDPAHIKATSTEHFRQLIERDASGQPDARRSALAFWRFGPELDSDELRALWQLLPADTRIPDHTIWTHLDLSAAFASSFAADADANPALLSMAFGPVQDFIAQARTTSDLWAGSHLLSRIAWAGLKVICERLGPDAVIFPQLRGVPLVDLWLRDEMGVSAKRFLDCEWAKESNRTDANPLFAAALPNKLVVIVPAGQAQALAEAVTRAVRDFVRDTAQGMLADLLDAAGVDNSPELPCHAQLAAQLDGFPEVHWAAVPFAPLVKEGEAAPDVTELNKAGEPFFGSGGFLASPAWQRLQKPLELEGTRFYRPNAGVLYPALYELLDRVAASAKSVRAAPQRPNGGEQGYRCDLTGEAEWLTHDRNHLAIPKGERKKTDTLWNRAINKRPGLSRKGEHLSALAMLKRLWPRWFVEHELSNCNIDVRRFVVSTHTLAVSTSLERWLQQGAPIGDIGEQLLTKAETEDVDFAALPRRLMKQLFTARQYSEKQRELARALPALMENDSSDDPEARNASADLVRKLLGDKPEAYYALILLDGDKMGAWISGTDADKLLKTRDTFHPQIRERMKVHFTRPEHLEYLGAERAVSPSRHMAISSALNSFALTLAQDIVENRCKGKLLYAGGDDVMALVAVDDLLACLTLLRAAYGGLSLHDKDDPKEPGPLAKSLQLDLDRLKLGGGHALLDGRLLRLMGEHATASAGAVIAHHSAPLGAVLRRLREAEKRAKSKGGRDAFAITLMKRGGGATDLTLPWRLDQPGDGQKPTLDGSPMQLLASLTTLFAGDDTSRKAAYVTQGWMPHLPTQMGTEALNPLLARNLAHRFKRQGAREHLADEYGDKLAKLALHPRLVNTDSGITPDQVITDVLAVAEFLARESRAPKITLTAQER